MLSVVELWLNISRLASDTDIGFHSPLTRRTEPPPAQGLRRVVGNLEGPRPLVSTSSSEVTEERLRQSGRQKERLQPSQALPRRLHKSRGRPDLRAGPDPSTGAESRVEAAPERSQRSALDPPDAASSRRPTLGASSPSAEGHAVNRLGAPDTKRRPTVILGPFSPSPPEHVHVDTQQEQRAQPSGSSQASSPVFSTQQLQRAQTSHGQVLSPVLSLGGTTMVGSPEPPSGNPAIYSKPIQSRPPPPPSSPQLQRAGTSLSPVISMGGPTTVRGPVTGTIMEDGRLLTTYGYNTGRQGKPAINPAPSSPSSTTGSTQSGCLPC